MQRTWIRPDYNIIDNFNFNLKKYFLFTDGVLGFWGTQPEGQLLAQGSKGAPSRNRGRTTR